MSGNKAKYKDLCAGGRLPVFFNDWWLDAVCGSDNWDVVLYELNNKIAAVLPFYKTKKYGLTVIKMPLLTQYLGPLLFYPENLKYASKIGFEHEALDYLYSHLPNFQFLRNRFTPAIKNWMALYWKGYRQTTRYTYVLNVEDTDRIYSEFKSSVRGKIKKAEHIVRIEFTEDICSFYELLNKTFKRQGLKNPVDLRRLQILDKALDANNSRKIAVAIDKENKIHSAAYLLTDSTCGYLSMLGEDPELRNSGAGILLVWEMIKLSKQLGLEKFDFLGSMLKNVEPVRRSFGAEQTPYFEITKSPLPFI